VVREGLDDDSVRLATARLTGLLTTASLPTILRAAYAAVGQEEYGLEHLLPGGAERIASTILAQLVDRFSEAYAGLYEDNRRTLDLLASAGMTLPRELGAAVEFTLGRRFEEEIARQGESEDPEAYRRAIVLAEEIAARGWQVDRSRSQALFERMIERQVEGVLARPSRERLEAAIQLLVLAGRLRLAPDLARPQERLYDALVAEDGAGELGALARGDAGAPGLTALVERLADLLRIAPSALER
jgi:hypothetical protein